VYRLTYNHGWPLLVRQAARRGTQGMCVCVWKYTRFNTQSVRSGLRAASGYHHCFTAAADDSPFPPDLFLIRPVSTPPPCGVLFTRFPQPPAYIHPSIPRSFTQLCIKTRLMHRHEHDDMEFQFIRLFRTRNPYVAAS